MIGVVERIMPVEVLHRNMRVVVLAFPDRLCRADQAQFDRIDFYPTTGMSFDLVVEQGFDPTTQRIWHRFTGVRNVTMPEDDPIEWARKLIQDAKDSVSVERSG